MMVVEQVEQAVVVMTGIVVAAVSDSSTDVGGDSGGNGCKRGGNCGVGGEEEAVVIMTGISAAAVDGSSADVGGIMQLTR